MIVIYQWRHRLVSPGAVTEWCHLFTSKLMTLVIVFLVKPPSPLAPSPPFQVIFSQCSSKFSYRKFLLSLGCHPLDGVYRGGPAPNPRPLVTPLQFTVRITVRAMVSNRLVTFVYVN